MKFRNSFIRRFFSYNKSKIYYSTNCFISKRISIIRSLINNNIHSIRISEVIEMEIGWIIFEEINWIVSIGLMPILIINLPRSISIKNSIFSFHNFKLVTKSFSKSPCISWCNLSTYLNVMRTENKISNRWVKKQFICTFSYNF
jgi:hypothetical protein